MCLKCWWFRALDLILAYNTPDFVYVKMTWRNELLQSVLLLNDKVVWGRFFLTNRLTYFVDLSGNLQALPKSEMPMLGTFSLQELCQVLHRLLFNRRSWGKP